MSTGGVGPEAGSVPSECGPKASSPEAVAGGGVVPATNGEASRSSPKEDVGGHGREGDVITEESPATASKPPNGSSSTPPPPSQSEAPSVDLAAAHQNQNTYLSHQHMGYYPYQVTPTPPSPIPSATGGYDVQAMLMQQQAAMAQQGSPFRSPQYNTGVPAPPLSPAQPNSNNTNNANVGLIPPASPLFPAGASHLTFPNTTAEQIDPTRIVGSSLVAPPSPTVSYISGPAVPNSPLGYNMYQHPYGGPGAPYTNPTTRDSPTPLTPDSWVNRPSHHLIYHTGTGTAAASPHIQAQGANAQFSSVSRTNSSRNGSQSVDDMLPPPALDQQDQNQTTYAHQSNIRQGAGNGGTLFAHQHPWGYSPGSDIYSGSPSSIRHHSNHRAGDYYKQQGGSRNSASHHRHGGPPLSSHTSHYYPITTPGPPIQTTPSNKGPDGANLFIFHIPNHFTNVDMYHLFCSYGTLLSVRIMVEKDTGRSRGFGFVSYDSPESAAMAIKELNGFVIGNKRLKVQHKQIRASDHGGSHHLSHLPHTPYLPATDSTVESSGVPVDASVAGKVGSGANQSKWYSQDDVDGSESGDFVTQDLMGSANTGSFPKAKKDDETTSNEVNLVAAVPSDANVPVSPDENSRVRANHSSARAAVSESSPSSLDDSGAVGKVASGEPQAGKGSSSSPLEQLGTLRNALPDASK